MSKWRRLPLLSLIWQYKKIQKLQYKQGEHYSENENVGGEAFQPSLTCIWLQSGFQSMLHNHRCLVNKALTVYHDHLCHHEHLHHLWTGQASKTDEISEKFRPLTPHPHFRKIMFYNGHKAFKNWRNHIWLHNAYGSDSPGRGKWSK